MAVELILDTTVLVDLEREALAGVPGPAMAFLEAHPGERLYLTFTVAGELAAGPGVSGRAQWEALIAPFEILPATPDVCWHYGRAYRYLATNGLTIGANDLWIAATALAHGHAVVTRNVREYQRVPGLVVVGY
ncbi:MAG: type II toxin-antitoxin system VapC family toxin [Gemmatimonadales bacterium]